MEHARGLMAFYADIAPEAVEDYRRWHNCEHMLERVSIPGFRRGRRYAGHPGAPGFLMMYETADAAVLGSAAYRAALDAPTPWTRRALTWFRNPVRNIYALAASAGAAPASPAPALFTLRFNLVGEGAEAARRALCETRLQALAARPDVARARLWAIDEEISAIVTSERKIYGGGPGAQRWLAMVETTHADANVALAELIGGDEAFADVFFDRFWLDFALEAPRPAEGGAS